MNSTLLEIQDFVAAHLVETESLATNETIKEACKAVTTGNERLSPVEQLDIYREQFWLRHTGALEEDFVSVAHLLGKEPFYALCVKYIKMLPPSSYTLRDLGDRFAEFVARTAPYSDDALLVDLARTEWSFIEAFDAPDAPPLDVNKIAATPEDAWPGAIVVVHPAVRLLELRYPAQDFRAAARTCETDCDGEAETIARPEPQATYVVVFRAPEALKYIDVEREAFTLLQKLARKIPLGRACEETVAELSLDAASFEANVGAWFSQWTQWGWVVDLVV